MSSNISEVKPEAQKYIIDRLRYYLDMAEKGHLQGFAFCGLDSQSFVHFDNYGSSTCSKLELIGACQVLSRDIMDAHNLALRVPAEDFCE